MEAFLVHLGFDHAIVTIVLGPLLTTLLAAVDVPSWSATRRRVTALVVALAGGLVVWWSGAYPASWEAITGAAALVLASMQTSFTILKQVGFIDWVGRVTPGGETEESSE